MESAFNAIMDMISIPKDNANFKISIFVAFILIGINTETRHGRTAGVA